MPKVICEKYSNYRDLLTKVQFASVLDHRSGCYVVMDEVDDDQAELFAAREGFEVLSDEEFATLTTAPAAPQEGTDSASPAIPAGDELEALSYNEVVARAKELGLDLRGKKPEILARIREKLAQEQE